MVNQEELNYLKLMKDILDNGDEREDRTGVGTRSLFGASLRFSLANNKVPVLTTKKMFLKGVVNELLFFLRGETDTKKLEAEGVNIWKGNTSREFLDKRGLYDLPEGDMGKLYGYAWRNFGGQITSSEYDSSRKPPMNRYVNGVDQVKNALDMIKNDPYSRRIIVSAWNPKQMDECALAPCHCFYQFYVNGGKLSLQWYQRSCDFFLGAPFNILSYAILTKMFAKAAHLEPGEIILSSGDIHCYKSHIEQAREQLTRQPYEFPELYIDKEINSVEDMENLTFKDFRLENYKFHPAIKAAMCI